MASRSLMVAGTHKVETRASSEILVARGWTMGWAPPPARAAREPANVCPHGVKGTKGRGPPVCGVAGRDVSVCVGRYPRSSHLHWVMSMSITVEGIHLREAGRTGKPSVLDQPQLKLGMPGHPPARLGIHCERFPATSDNGDKRECSGQAWPWGDLGPALGEGWLMEGIDPVWEWEASRHCRGDRDEAFM